MSKLVVALRFGETKTSPWQVRLGLLFDGGGSNFWFWKNVDGSVVTGEHLAFVSGRRQGQREFCSKIVAWWSEFRQPFEAMKRPLGRGLENLMPTDDSGDPAPDRPRSSAVGVASQPRTGVDRLIGGGEQLELGARLRPQNALSPRSSQAPEYAPARVPAWIYYLADLVLVSAVIWLIVLSSGPLSQQEVLLCLGLGVLAAVLGSWPWLRNVLFCAEIGEAKNLPDWIIAENVDFGGDTKCLVLHLKKPYVAVEVTETSWNGVNAKPYWIDGPPNLPPGGARQLLDQATLFFQEHQQSRAAVAKSRNLVAERPASEVPSSPPVGKSSESAAVSYTEFPGRDETESGLGSA